MAEVLLERVELERAEELARRSIDRAEAACIPDVLCEALLVLGRVQRPNGLADAQRSFQRASDVAERAGLEHWHLRARQELAIMDWFGGDLAPMRSTRDLAARYGAHFTAAAMDLTLADVALANFDPSECIAAATACAEASRRYGLATESVANLWLAGGHALAGDDEAMKAAAQTALAKDPDDPRLLADLYGRVYTTRAFIRDELDDLPNLLDEMIVHVRRAPTTTSIYPGRILWALVHTIADDDFGAAARVEYDRDHGANGLRTLRDARPGHGRRHARSDRLPGRSDRRVHRCRPRGLRAIPAAGMVHSSMLLVSGAAIRDGWGDPVRLAPGRGGVVRRTRLRPARPSGPVAARRGRCTGASARSWRLRGARRRCGPSASRAARSTCSSWWSRADRTRRSPPSCTSRRRPSNAT